MHRGGVLINRSTLMGVTVAFDRCQRSNLGVAEGFKLFELPVFWCNCGVDIEEDGPLE